MFHSLGGSSYCLKFDKSRGTSPFKEIILGRGVSIP